MPLLDWFEQIVQYSHCPAKNAYLTSKHCPTKSVIIRDAYFSGLTQWPKTQKIKSGAITHWVNPLNCWC
jgi:hypothetical protein